MPIRVLIADDNEIVRSRLAEMLGSHEGWTICAAVQNGREAVEKSNELKPNVIVLDLAMPGLDGLSATREILRTLPTVPILIYTLHNIPAIELEAKKAGARKMVLKPHVELLISAIEEILGNESQASEVLSTPAATTSNSEANPSAVVTADLIANNSADSAVTMSAAPSTAAPVSSSDAALASTTEVAETNAAGSDGDSAAPLAMGEPAPSS
jgi:DNA-binding NarL/FixJ family response regulator